MLSGLAEFECSRKRSVTADCHGLSRRAVDCYRSAAHELIRRNGGEHCGHGVGCVSRESGVRRVPGSSNGVGGISSRSVRGSSTEHGSFNGQRRRGNAVLSGLGEFKRCRKYSVTAQGNGRSVGIVDKDAGVCRELIVVLRSELHGHGVCCVSRKGAVRSIPGGIDRIVGIK